MERNLVDQLQQNIGNFEKQKEKEAAAKKQSAKKNQMSPKSLRSQVSTKNLGKNRFEQYKQKKVVAAKATDDLKDYNNLKQRLEKNTGRKVNSKPERKGWDTNKGGFNQEEQKSDNQIRDVEIRQSPIPKEESSSSENLFTANGMRSG